MDGRTVQKLLAGAVMGAAGVGVGYAVARLGMAQGPAGGRTSLAGKLAGVAILGFGAWLALVAHEAGHLAGGISQGFRFIFLAAGPLWLERQGAGLAVRFNRTIHTWGGMAAAMPQDDLDLRRRFSVMVAGGPVASLVLALGAWAAWVALPPGNARFLSAVVAIASGGFFVATVQPFGAGGGFASDGGRLLRLWRKGPVGERELALLTLTAASVGGVRPRDWSPVIIDAALLPSDGSVMELVARVFAAQRASDTGDAGAAQAHLAKALEQGRELSPLVLSIVASEAAWLRANLGDVDGARMLLAQADGPFVERHAVHRARAALCRAEGDVAGARREAEAGIAALPRARFGKPSERDRELLDALRAG